MSRWDPRRRFMLAEFFLVLLVFCICLAGALSLPVNKCPDEGARRTLSDWILQTGTLPTGNEIETTLLPWGFSYALRPFLSAILSAGFTKAASLFTASPRILLAASRLGSVLSVTICCYYCLRMGRRLFQKRSSVFLFAAFVSFLPQVLFLGMYQNNDSLSLCAVSMILCSLVEGHDQKWPVRSCVELAVGFSLGLLSYYTIYGWILAGVFFCVISVARDREIDRKGRFILRRAGLIAAICLVLAGWFFLRSAILHQGDLLGYAAEARSRAYWEAQGYKGPYLSCRDDGLSVWEFLLFRNKDWIFATTRSFVGIFGNMDLLLPFRRYGFYYAFFDLALLLAGAVMLRRRPDRRNALFLLTLLLSAAITFFLHFWHSYTRDYQPQGRYIITVIFVFAYLLCYGLDRTELRLSPLEDDGSAAPLPLTETLCLIWLFLAASSLMVMSEMLG